MHCARLSVQVSPHLRQLAAYATPVWSLGILRMISPCSWSHGRGVTLSLPFAGLPSSALFGQSDEASKGRSHLVCACCLPLFAVAVVAVLVVLCLSLARWPPEFVSSSPLLSWLVLVRMPSLAEAESTASCALARDGLCNSARRGIVATPAVAVGWRASAAGTLQAVFSELALMSCDCNFSPQIRDEKVASRGCFDTICRVLRWLAAGCS